MQISLTSRINKLILGSIYAAQELKSLPNVPIDDFTVERPQNASHGDFATGIAMKLAKPMRMAPLAIATEIRRNLKTDELIEAIELVTPGFINIFISKNWLTNQLEEILMNPDTFGNSNIGMGEKLQIEYISVNPTGKLHIGHARGAIIGSALANMLKAANYKVHQEYYLNDAGSQIDKLNQSVFSRYQQLMGKNTPMPEDSYPGDDVIKVANKIKLKVDSQIGGESDADILQLSKELSVQYMIDLINEDVKDLRIEFDNWFSEKSLLDNGEFEACIAQLRSLDLVEEKEGALWLKSTKIGEEKDNVLIRSSGIPTYFATDIAYHFNKFQKRGFDRVIDVWGADHQGQVPRLKSAVKALGVDSEKLHMILVQMVRFKSGETSEKLSKREGNIIPLEDLIKEIGADACRFVFLSRSHEAQLEFDMDLVKSQSSDNPVYYVQYAHARICSILRLSRDRNITYTEADLKLLQHQSEISLIHKLFQFPDILETIARNYEPHHMTHYSLELATAFHTFYQQCRVISDKPSDIDLTKARLKLADATRVILNRALTLMSMSAPEKM